MLSLREQRPARQRSAAEDLEFEIRFFKGVTRRDPGCIDALQILGDAYTRTGRWREGLKVDQRLAHLCPDNPAVFYNLTCSYALLQHLDEAFAALDKAVRLGYHDARWLAKDPDLANLRHDARFQRIRAKLASKVK